MPINKSLKAIPENIAPRDRINNGINITNGDSCNSFKEIFLLLNVPWKVLKTSLQEYIDVRKAVKIPIVDAK